MGGFLSGLFDEIGPRLKERHEQDLALQLKRKQDEYSTYSSSKQAAASKIMEIKAKGDAATDDDLRSLRDAAGQYKWSSEALARLTRGNKELSQEMAQVDAIVNQLLTRPSPKAQLTGPGEGPVSEQPTSQSLASSAGITPLSAPSIPLPKGSMMGALAMKQQREDESNPRNIAASISESDRKRREAWIKQDDEAKEWSARDRFEFIETGKFPTQASAGLKRPIRYKLPDGSTVDAFYDSKTGDVFDIRNKPYVPPEGAQVVGQPRASIPRVIGRISITNAQDEAAKHHTVYADESGNPIPVAELPKDMELVATRTAEGTFYTPLSQNQKTITVGGMVYGVPTLEQVRAAQGAGVPLGPARTGTESTTENFEYGNVRTTVPQVPGMSAPPSQAPTVAPPPQSQVTAPAPQASPAPAQQTPAQIPPSTSPQSRRGNLGERAYSPTFQTQQMKTGPIIQAATQLGGDPNDPEAGSLEILADIVEDKQARQKLQTALRLTLDQMESVEKANPGFLDLVKANMGVPAMMASALASMRAKVVDKLKDDPRLVQAYDKIMAAYGTIVGMRAATGASPSMAAVATLERELPLPGLNVTTRQGVYDKLANLEQEAVNYLDRQSDAAVDPSGKGTSVKKYYRDRAKYFREKATSSVTPKGKLTTPGSLPKPRTKGETATEEVLRAYLNANGGDKSKTRKALTDAGFSIGK